MQHAIQAFYLFIDLVELIIEVLGLKVRSQVLSVVFEAVLTSGLVTQLDKFRIDVSELFAAIVSPHLPQVGYVGVVAALLKYGCDIRVEWQYDVLFFATAVYLSQVDLGRGEYARHFDLELFPLEQLLGIGQSRVAHETHRTKEPTP